MLDRGATMGNLMLGIDGGVPRTTSTARAALGSGGRAASRGMPASKGLRRRASGFTALMRTTVEALAIGDRIVCNDFGHKLRLALMNFIRGNDQRRLGILLSTARRWRRADDRIRSCPAVKALTADWPRQTEFGRAWSAGSRLFARLPMSDARYSPPALFRRSTSYRPISDGCALSTQSRPAFAALPPKHATVRQNEYIGGGPGGSLSCFYERTETASQRSPLLQSALYVVTPLRWPIALRRARR